MADNEWSEWGRENPYDDNPEIEDPNQSLGYTIVIVLLLWGLTCIGWKRYLRERSRLMAMQDNDHTNSEEEERVEAQPTPTQREADKVSSERQKFVRKYLESKEWCVRANFTISGSTGGDEEQDLEAVLGSRCAEPECPICLTPFSKKERVSSSTNPLCPHIFHHKCVYQWLLHKKECPMCRNVFLKQDILTDNDTRDTKSLAEEPAPSTSHRTLVVFFGRAEDHQETHPSNLEEARA